MKKLDEILTGISILNSEGPTDLPIGSIRFDSRQSGKDWLFVAMKGTRTDGHKFIDQAVANGAVALLCEDPPGKLSAPVTVIRVENPARALGTAAANFFDHPSHSLTLVGVTGTNGKTTVATLLYELFTMLGFSCGLISTIRNKVAGKDHASTHTTPDALGINGLLREMADGGCSHCFMEVSSHAIQQERISGLRFRGGMFTNITHDHLDYHGTFKDYIRTKKRFFDQLPGDAFALINSDDRNGQFMVQNTSAAVSTYALKSMADYTCRLLEEHMDGTLILLENKELWSRLVGEFNMYNLLCIYACARLLGQPAEKLQETISTLRPVSGRLESIPLADNKTAIVDYAHSPDALKKVLTTISRIRDKGSAVVTVLGAGGDRDRAKRPIMAAIASDLSDKVILTADNPRSEDPLAIIEEMGRGVPGKKAAGVLKVPDRAEAIKTAVLLAGRGDIILVAGKGHENYQEINGKRHHFDDKEELKKYRDETLKD